MSNLAIKVENVSKLYRLGAVGTGTLSNDLTRFWAKLRGKEDPFSKIATSNDRSKKSNSDFVWSLQNIDFEIKKGDAVGIIGRNGAGKSTLLKVLSRITSPTTGRVRIDGRVASLLEVGTGFSPDLTGRQNIYMNGAILGMTRAEVTAKMDEIIDFSGVEGYIDTPVKRYSSGMYVRLAFAVAAHLEPEILIVDEVLAVGDAEFQKKCLGKMQDVNKSEGRTVLFVSHNIGAITNLCTTSLVLKNGNLAFHGNVNDGVALYMKDSDALQSLYYVNQNPKATDILKITILNTNGENVDAFLFNEEVILQFEIQFEKHHAEAVLGFRIKDQSQRNVFTSEINISDYTAIDGKCSIRARIPACTLVPNSYYPLVALHIPQVEVLSLVEDKLFFKIEETGTDFYKYAGNDYGCVFVKCVWE